jgi:hypothetical protein
MRRSVQPTFGPMEVNRVDRPKPASSDVVNKVDRLEIPLEMAKAKFGAAVGRAIGDEPLKTYGDKGLLSNVIAGPKVPDYLGRIYQDRASRRRLAKALLADDAGVVMTTHITILDDEEKVG